MDIVLAGSISYDYIMHYQGAFAALFPSQSVDTFQVTFPVDNMHQHMGGVSANIAYSLALLGGKPRLFGTVGTDFEPYRERLEQVGVDTSTVMVIEDDVTAIFFANTDTNNNQLGVFYAGAMRYADQYSIEQYVPAIPDLVVISPNAPQAMSNQIEECRLAKIPYVFDPSQQTIILPPEVLRQGIEGAYAIACNDYEWDVIQHRTGLTLGDVEHAIFIHTLGEKGAAIYAEGQQYIIPSYQANEVVNPTGAGDAFRAGLLRGISLGFGWNLAGRMGALCATYALEQHGTQTHSFGYNEFAQRLRTTYDDQGQLDIFVG